MSTVLGRDDEVAQLATLVQQARRGRSGVTIIEGDPGVGKSTLGEAVLTAAPDLLVLRLRGVEIEGDLAYAALQRLVHPHRAVIDALPESYAHHLRAAVGLEPEPYLNRGLVGMGLLALLTALAEDVTVTCWVDDAQWLDAESAAVLAFAARRLSTERVAMMLAARPSPLIDAVFTDLPRLPLGGLADDDAARLLRTVVAAPLEPRVADRIVAATGGNPLAIIDLSQELTAVQLAGESVLPEPTPIGSSLEDHYLRRVARLEPAARTWLLLAAAESAGDPLYVARAARRLGLPPAASEAAEAARLVTVGSAITFRHALVRAAVYNGATTGQRRAVHAALAEVTDAGPDSDRRAWHLAAAADGPDEDVARRLEQSAARAGDRGGLTARASLLLRAAALSETEHTRRLRRLAALEAAVEAGSGVQAGALLAAVDGAALKGLDRGRFLVAQSVTAVLVSEPGGCARRAATMVAAAEAFGAETDPERVATARLLRRNALLDALFEAYTADFLVDGTSVAAIAAAVRADAGLEAGAVGRLVTALADAALDGTASAAPRLRAAVREWLHPDTPDDDVLLATRPAILAADLLWDPALRHRVVARAEAVTRARGALFALVQLLIGHAVGETHVGRLRTAVAVMAEAVQVRLTLGLTDAHVPHHMINPELAAWLGEEDVLRADRERIEAGMTYIGVGVLVVTRRLAVMVLEMSRGDYAAADAIARGMEFGDGIRASFRALPDVVECAHRAGDTARAGRLLAHFAGIARASGTPRALGLLARCEALLAADDTADERYQDAVRLTGESGVDLDLARAHLLYGEWLRRRRRRSEARAHLRTAAELFDELGATLFAERARRELAATGERAQPRATAGGDLTPQETAVAELARHGATNLEIATRLYVSPNTVDYHLRKIFRKLGVTSRRQLDDTLPR